MNIVIATGIYPPEIGVMATVVKELAERLASLGQKITVVSYGDVESRSGENFSVHIISRRSALPVRYFRYLLRLFSVGKNCDLIYGQDLVSSGLPAAAASWLLNKKLVLRLGGDFLWEKMLDEGVTGLPLEQYHDSPKSLREKIYLLIYRFVLHRSSGIIFNSILQSELYQKHFDLSRKKVAVVHNPLLFAVEPKELIEGDIVYAGRFIAFKNVEMLIRAYSSLSTRKKLQLIGEGSFEPRYRRLIGELQLGGRVLICKSLAREKLREKLKHSYLLVVPSLTEINPNVAVECLSLGTPVLITERTGILPQLKQKLMTFDPLSEKSLAEKLSYLLDERNYKNYLKRLEGLTFEHSWDSVVSKHLEIFSQVIRPLAE
jgi:glycosyltransferase involved in cell wall biosynthesis